MRLIRPARPIGWVLWAEDPAVAGAGAVRVQMSFVKYKETRAGGPAAGGPPRIAAFTQGWKDLGTRTRAVAVVGEGGRMRGLR